MTFFRKLVLEPAWVTFLILASASLALTGCSTASVDNSQSVGAVGKPTISLVSPSVGQALPSDGVEVSVQISGFQIDPNAVGKAKVNGHGHWHLYLDGEFVQAVVQEQFLLEPLPQGPHHIRVSLANNDHSPLTPPVEDSVVVDVVGGIGIASVNTELSAN